MLETDVNGLDRTVTNWLETCSTNWTPKFQWELLDWCIHRKKFLASRFTSALCRPLNMHRSVELLISTEIPTFCHEPSSYTNAQVIFVLMLGLGKKNTWLGWEKMSWFGLKNNKTRTPVPWIKILVCLSHKPQPMSLCGFRQSVALSVEYWHGGIMIHW